VKVLILAGGVGSRLSEETVSRPKPMVEIGRRPILWHIMKSYAYYGFNDFVVALGYKGEQVKRYFAERNSLEGDMTFDFRTGEIRNHERRRDEWTVTLVDTGQHTETAGRMLRARSHLGDGPFMMTYGDGVADVDLAQLLEFHRSHGKLATVTAVRPLARFGHLEIGDDALVKVFHEKPQMDEGWINGGFFVLEPDVFDVIPGDCNWSKEPLERLASAGQLVAFRHKGFWQCMDTLREKEYLDALWETGEAPWRTWNPGP
jgi:glucose-1-phosphate cytidylyltransferase